MRLCHSVLASFLDGNASITRKYWESYYQLRQRIANKRSISSKHPLPGKRKKPPKFVIEDDRLRGCRRAGEFETLLHGDYRVCVPRERSLGKRRPFFNYLTLLILFTPFSSKKRRNAARKRGISTVHLFCLHILVRPTGFEPAAFRVGVIRLSKGKPLWRKGFSRFARFSQLLGERPGAIAPQRLREFCK